MTIYIKNTPTNDDGLPTVLYDNLLASATLTVSSEATDYPKENAVSEATTEYWKPTSLPATLTGDLGSSKACNALAIIGHDLGSKNCTITLSGSSNGTTFTNVHADVSPADDGVVLLLFPAASYRYWRLSITAGDSAPYVSVVMLGERFTFPAGVRPPYTPVWLSQSYELLTANSVGGQFMGNRVIRGGGKTAINLVALEREYAENDLLPFREHYNLGKAFVWASSPYFFPNDVGYVWRTENSVMSPTFDNTGTWMSTGMEVYAYGN